MFNKKKTMLLHFITNICTKLIHGISTLASYLTGPQRHVLAAVKTVYLHPGSSALFASSFIQMLR